jgi:hypothetical protein
MSRLNGVGLRKDIGQSDSEHTVLRIGPQNRAGETALVHSQRGASERELATKVFYTFVVLCEIG